jgi:hypothetical protein
LAWYVLDALGAGSHARGTNNISEEALAAHPLMKLAMENVVPLLEEAKFGLVALAEKSEVRREGEATLLEYEFYDDDVFRNAGAAVEALDRLGQSQRLIEAASKGSWEGSGLDRHMWIEYHYSYYIVTFVSLADIALVLTNSAFRLGNRERDCKPDTITRNWWVAQTPAAGLFERDVLDCMSPSRAPCSSVNQHA